MVLHHIIDKQSFDKKKQNKMFTVWTKQDIFICALHEEKHNNNIDAFWIIMSLHSVKSHAKLS